MVGHCVVTKGKGVPASEYDERAFLLAQAFTPGEEDPQELFFFVSAPLGAERAAWKAPAMAHTFHQLFYHFAWATSSRIALIHHDWRPGLLKIINEETKKRDGWPIRHNAMPDHVHLLIRLPPTLMISEFIGQVKGVACHRVNEEIRPSFRLKWQEGYGVLTLRESELEKVSRYIDNQETPHGTGRLSALLERTEGENESAPAAPPPEGG
jgi:putative transposase